MLIKVILDLFVRDVDTKLLKRVLLKILKAEYVKNSDSETLGATKKKRVNYRCTCMYRMCVYLFRFKLEHHISLSVGVDSTK